ncbi:MAG: exo-alpha-sialidase [Planctomycetales bacterium]|nr:exo-alpha-sialidase [Planctomycetales bacterium]
MKRKTNHLRFWLAASAWLSAVAVSDGLSAAPQGDPSFAEQPLFVSGEGGYHTYRIPALVTTRQGTLLAFCEGRKTSRSDHGDVDLVLKRSTDGGQHWGDLQLVAEEGGEAKITIGNPCPVVDTETGIIWLPFTRDNDAVLICHSEDDGRTWSSPREITDSVKRPNWTWYATGPGVGIQIERGEHAGRLVIPCDHRVRDVADRRSSTRSHAIFSDDHGRTWQAGEATDFKMNECAVVERTDGSLLLNMRSNLGLGRRGVAVSEDGGKSWSEVRNDERLIEPVCQASMIRYDWPSDDGPGRVLFANPANGKSRRQMTVRLCVDDGRTWPLSREVYSGSSAYSSLGKLPSGEVVLLYERDDYHTIHFARFNLAWLQAD